jgi:hypothetical protein
MRLRSPSQGPSAGIGAGVHENARPESPVPHPPPLSPKESTMTYEYRDYDSNLSAIMALPKITGAALVSAFGNEMECIRSIGDAPSIGSRSHTGVGLTGICFSTGKVELCNDVENDPRADLQACADLGVRSVLVVPIWQNSRVAGVLEALSSKPNAFDWRTIRHIRRLARAFDPATLESWAPSPERQNRVEDAASVSVGARTVELEMQTVLASARRLQNGSVAPVTASASEDRGKKFDNSQPDYQVQQRDCLALQPLGELPSRQCTRPRALEVGRDAVPSFLTLEEGFSRNGRPWRFVSVIVLLVILFFCFFEFRTHLISFNALLDISARFPRASGRSAAASRKGLRNDLPSESASGSHLRVKKSSPNARTAVAQSSEGAVARFEKPQHNDDAEASWQVASAYLKGDGLPQDEGQAAKWLKKAANLGDPRAQAALSDLYLKDIGVHRDYVRAYTWATIATGNAGGEDERLASIRHRMTRSELEDANRRIQTWFHAQGISK